MCRKRTCTTPGRYHLAYGFELASADVDSLWTPSLFTFYLLMFAPAFIIGDDINITVALLSLALASHDLGVVRQHVVDRRIRPVARVQGEQPPLPSIVTFANAHDRCYGRCIVVRRARVVCLHVYSSPPPTSASWGQSRASLLPN